MRLHGITAAGLKRVSQFMQGGPSEILYHITFYRNLGSIAAEGLQVGYGGGAGQGAGYQEHSSQGVFTTEWGGVFSWFNKVEAWGESMLSGSQSTYSEDLFPVVLAVKHEGSDPVYDEIGSNDVFEDAWILQPEEVPEESVLLWNGEAWVDIQDWGTIDPDKAFTKEHSGEFDEYGEEEIYYWETEYLLPTEPAPLEAFDLEETE